MFCLQYVWRHDAFWDDTQDHSPFWFTNEDQQVWVPGTKAHFDSLKRDGFKYSEANIIPPEHAIKGDSNEWLTVKVSGFIVDGAKQSLRAISKNSYLQVRHSWIEVID